MRQWRVGSFSMALVLIILGVALLIAQFSNTPAWKLLAKWWPATLILLGMEILLAAYFSKKDSPRIKYDFFAVIMVLIVGGLSLGFYSFSASGVLAGINRAVTSITYTMDLPESRQPIPAEIREITLRTGSGQLDLHTGALNGETVFFGQAEITASSLEEAKQVVSSGNLTTHQVGDQLFIELTGLPTYHDDFFNTPRVERGSYTLVVPRNIALKVIGNKDFTPLEVSIDALESKWMISNNGPVRVRLSKNSNVEVVATSSEGLFGNAPWQLAQKSRERSIEVEGRIKLGQGTALLMITSTSSIRLDIVE